MEAKTLQIITNELYKYGKLIKEDEVKEVVELCQKANRIFIAGAGRSGFCARGFANRMMHLGFTVYFVGETTTPSIQEGDLLIVGSGSGTTASPPSPGFGITISPPVSSSGTKSSATFLRSEPGENIYQFESINALGLAV